MSETNETHWSERITVLEGHRNRWRRLAFALVDTIQSLDPDSDPEALRAAVKAARGRVAEMFEEKGALSC